MRHMDYFYAIFLFYAKMRAYTFKIRIIFGQTIPFYWLDLINSSLNVTGCISRKKK